MNNIGQTPGQYVYEAELMNQIMEVRYTDLGKNIELCKLLLNSAEPEQHTYGCTFANVYLFNGFLALRDFEACDIYFRRALFLCRKHGYDDLMLMLCNCAGMYYQKLSDEREALKYYLEGLRLADTLKDYNTKGKLYNNIGLGFSAREDWETAADYFRMAYETADACSNQFGFGNHVSYLCNLAESYKMLEKVEEAGKTLEICESLEISGEYQRYRLDCAWSSYYSVLCDAKKCLEITNRILERGLLEFESKMFVYDMAEGLMKSMLEIKEYEKAVFLLEYLEKSAKLVSLYSRYNTNLLKIRLLEEIGAEDELDLAYKTYYEIVVQKTAVDDSIRAQSMNSKIQLTYTQLEQEELSAHNRELESVTQIDELTGLYNRRYFNKLVSKLMNMGEVRTLGFIMIDVDYFKQYNDFYGHFVGDNALKAVADSLRRWSCENLYSSRYGGDEFICICVNRTDEEVAAFINNIQTTLGEKKVLHEKSRCNEYLSLSIGYCNETYTADMRSEMLIELADQAMYDAKMAGRNQVARKRR